MRRPSKVAVVLGAGLALAGASGFAAATAVGGGSVNARTVTVHVGTGQRGPQGPPGPQGPAGLACPSGFAPGELVIDHPGGQVRTWTCLHS